MPFAPPAFVQLYPTTRCNQRCHFCFNSDSLATPRLRRSAGRPGTASDLSYSDALRLLDILESHGIREIDVMGGEPLILPWMPDFVDISVGKKLTVNLSTNGSNIRAISRFKNREPGECRIGISLEGSTAKRHNVITNSSHFDAAVGSIRHLVSRGLHPIAKTVLTKRNAADIQEIVALLRGIGVRRYYIIHMDLLSTDRILRKDLLGFQEFVSFYRKLKEANPDMDIFKVHASCFSKHHLPDGVRCAGGVRKLSILPDGSVFPCNLFHGFEEFNLGNIFKDDFSAIWNNPILKRFREYLGNKCDIDDCPHRTSCTGGCPAHGYYHYGETERTDIRCKLSHRPPDVA
jgi:radical SAM protein with 4Fe4S-binding SPASM domain